ncbi:MAG TPA: glutamate formimidoyltransferase [Actinomycetota bacterium]|nr:glutamate formimidoyltransferase [Actinomycetota bacterium]
MGEAERAAPIVGVVPNFSEGRRDDVIDAICDALEVPGARLVYRQADAEHHRLDTTVIGSADAVRRSALAGAAIAVARIDLREHRGAHPRMGAVDVVPFMPVRGVGMDDVVALARATGAELADTLGLPVYFYGEAATAPERRSLADVRRGGYEGVRDAVAAGERLPDLGPHDLGAAGAVAVGARMPLVAFNIYLTGDDASAAEAIARAVRESNGGLRAVRAIGFAVPDRDAVTVSMNLVDHATTGVREAFDAVAAHAADRGLEVLDAEIVGLAPAAAVPDAVAEHVRLRGFDPDRQILERLLEEER